MDQSRFYFFIPGTAIVHDNTGYSFFTPVRGGRWRAEINQALGDLQYTFSLLDYRRYYNTWPPLDVGRFYWSASTNVYRSCVLNVFSRCQSIAFIEEPTVIERILEHIGEPTQAPELLPARAPPQAEMDFDQSSESNEWPEVDQTAGMVDETWD